ncbi:MAG: hypothetical protein ACE5JD_11020 [Candidatus Methylomirabilia bacterium]
MPAGRWLPGTMGAIWGALQPAAALACAVCVSPTKDDLGLLWSALFLMVVPVGVVGLIGGWLYYSGSHRWSAGGRQPGSGVPRLTVTETEGAR